MIFDVLEFSSGYSVVRLSRCVWDAEVAGSNPATPTIGVACTKAGETALQAIWKDSISFASTSFLRSIDGDARDF